MCRQSMAGGIALVLSLGMLWAPAARAQGLIRDAEIEHALRQLVAPVATAAGFSASQLRVMVINDASLNAFVIIPRAY